MLVSGLIGWSEASLNHSRSPEGEKGQITSMSQEKARATPNWTMFTRAHCAIYRATRGLIGGNLLGIQMLLLTTRGRRTGKRRTLPLAYVEDRGDLVIVASNGGSDRHPAWWLNLREAESAEVQVGAERFEVTWREAARKDRIEYWRKLQAAIPAYRTYRFQSNREIPIVLLRRREVGWSSVPLRPQGTGDAATTTKADDADTDDPRTLARTTSGQTKR